MRTPVVLVAGQGDTDEACRTLMQEPGTVVVSHAFDGQVVRRAVTNLQHGVLASAELGLELINGCVCCTTRHDLLILLRRLSRRDHVSRIVVALSPELEPEPIRWAIDRVPVSPGPEFLPGPAGRDVDVTAVVTTIDTAAWLGRALGPDELADGRTAAQVAVAQAEGADVLLLDADESDTVAVLRRLTPAARVAVGIGGIEGLEREVALLGPNARRGRARDTHDPLLAGQPPLHPEGPVVLLEFSADRPFHPARLYTAVDVLLEGGVVRTRGRMFLAHRLDDVMTIDSAGGGLLVEPAGTWLAAMTADELADADPQRRAMASARWDERFGDRHTAMTILICGAAPEAITAALAGALLTDDELAHPEEWAEYGDPFPGDPVDDTAVADGPARQQGEAR